VVFARKIDDSLTSLVKKIDTVSQEKKIKSFVVMLSDDEGIEDQLKKLAEKNNLKKTVLTKDNVAGPSDYSIAKDAAVTVILYNKRKVEANHAFRQSDFNSKAVEAVVKDLPKITPKS
jgi:hypothetical protein